MLCKVMISQVVCPLYRCLSTTSISSGKIGTVAIIGAGLMGSGIAQVSATAKLNVTLMDKSEEILDKARKNIDTNLWRVAKKKHAEDKRAQDALVAGVLSRVHTTTSFEKVLENADLVIEAVIEDIEVKRKLFSEIERLIKPYVSGSQVVRHEDTSDDTFETLMEYGKDIGKKTVSCKTSHPTFQDTPGFIVNRLLVPYMFEALRMAERGDASIESTLFKFSGVPVGQRCSTALPHMAPSEEC
ncbi:3-hydroxyacyl-CoA dehydrogenase, NAD binding domain protein [Dictyocaulus viviparus]|uniref:3-hydroxyacyl-CoA dehydrogenase n=1 Tax=Dictyocaulus viviparus TaxID=29172 RepID=A0A0D8XAT4_DICVI|nr:3-hydroxyacyl-CoA dehydrogenase, NAD binding domain protein [Dictyocaulus viviparus]